MSLFAFLSTATIMLQPLNFDDTKDFEDASRGLIAPLPDGGVIKNDKGEVVWNLQRYRFLDTPQKDSDPSSPETVNPSLWRQARLLWHAGLFKVTEGIYQVRGADISNMTIVEGEKGIILIDPLLAKETARMALDLYYQHRPKKPVTAVIYTHSHADHFGGVKGVISQADVDSGKIKVIAPAGFTEAALTENVMAGNAMGRRAMYMYGALIDPGVEGQVTTGLGLAVSGGETTLILPTDYISKTGQKMVVDGVTLVFLMAWGSEAPAEMLFYLPEKKALCAAEDATHTMHNLYSLRGAKIRDAKAWAFYLNQAIEMFGGSAEVVFAQHHWPRWGNENVVDFLEKQRDLYKFIHDQSLHLANQGYTMVEIGEMIQLPESLAKEWYNRGYYGSLNHNAKSIYAFYLGWFNGNPSTLHALPEVDGAKKYVEYMGGATAVMDKAKKDIKKGNLRFAAEVLNHVVFADPTNQKAKDLLADTLTQLGYQAENATWRNFYLTGAKELRSGVQKSGALRFNNADVITSMPMENVLDFLAIAMNGMRAAEHPMSLNIQLTDTKENYLVQIKNGVLNYFPDKIGKDVAFTVALKRVDLNKLLMSQITPKDLIASKQMTLTGSVEAVSVFRSLFDRFDPTFNIVVPQK